MKLDKKKDLAAKTLNVGKNRILFNSGGLDEIKEAITKQDIRDLYKEGTISVKPVKGRKKVKKRKTARGPGKIKKKVKKRKQIYVKITRKLREYIARLKGHDIINRELYKDLRKKIRMRYFKSKANLKEYLSGLETIDLGKQIKSNNPKGKKLEKRKKKIVKVKTKKINKDLEENKSKI